ITVFEALPVLGGMMRVGIPLHRLPHEVLDKEIEEIKSAGFEIKTNTKVESAQKLLDEGYNAVLVAVGAHRGTRLPLPGADLDGVLVNTAFLKAANLGEPVKIGKRVVVLGGGNVAFDVARTARRLGADQVLVACLEASDCMLASPEEVEWGKEEGITIHNSQTFTKIVGENGKVAGVECLDVKSFHFDSEGKLQVDYAPESTHILPADTVIFAAGQSPELELIKGIDAIKTTRRRTLEVDPLTMATGKAGIFAAGDAVTGTTSVVEAIAGARRAVSAIDKYLGGTGDIEEQLVDVEKPNPYFGREEDFAYRPRTAMPCLPVPQRSGSFEEVELGFDKALAHVEANRCLQCDVRFTLSLPVLPPEKWLAFNAEIVSTVPENSGVFQLINEQKEIIAIKGCMNLRQELEAQLKSSNNARYFEYEETFMYTGRESELLQKFLQEHGKLPSGNQELDELF
ncbi:MAG: FAD-dependent oxidoreductase, partial [Chloroflexi bacterium]|nr:FAD-dependent oxidoreductase [Chloroflexota bacterium]